MTKALALVGAISMALSLPVAAADRPVVLQVIGVKVTGDMDAYLEKIKKAQSISKRLGTPTPRVWRSTLAGPDTGTVFVAIEHKNMATSISPPIPAGTVRTAIHFIRARSSWMADVQIIPC